MRAGDAVTWGVRSPTGETREQTFQVRAADPALDERLARLDDALVNQSGPVRAGLRAQALLQAGLPTEAYAAAGAVTDVADPSQPLRVRSVEGQGLAWLVMRAALGEVSGLEGTVLGNQVRQVVHRLPEDLREALTAPPAGD